MKEAQLAQRPDLSSSPSSAKSEHQAVAERRMRRGKGLVMSGFVVTIVGIVGYCLVCFSADTNRRLGAALLENPEWLVGPALGVIGLGTLLWLVGSFLYLSGAMDDESGAEGRDF